MSDDHFYCGGSLVCTTKSRKYQRRTRQRRVWHFDENDKGIIQEAVDHKLNKDMVLKQIGNFTTNKVEAFHNRCLKLNPKSKTNKNTYHCRNLHAVTIERMGIARGTRAYLAKCGIAVNGPGQNVTQKMDEKSVYNSERQRSNGFKIQRHKGKYKKLKLKWIAKLNVETARFQSSDHVY